MNDILAILSGGDYVSGEKISQELGISRAAVWKRIAQLREDGWPIEAAGRRGYRLIPGDSIDPIFWVNQLTTKTLGRAINHYEHTITSSNTLVKQMAVQGAPSGSLCLCECQTAGKGRLGRTWSAPRAGDPDERPPAAEAPAEKRAADYPRDRDGDGARRPRSDGH